MKFSRKNDLDLFKECLSSVMNFIFSDSQTQQSEFEFSFKKPNRKRQKILRELGFLDLLSTVVDNAFPNERVLNKV